MMEIIIPHNDNHSYEDNHGPLRDDNFHDNNHDSQLSHSVIMIHDYDYDHDDNQD